MIGYGKRLLLIHDPETTQSPLAAILRQEGFVLAQVQDEVQALWERQVRHFDAESSSTITSVPVIGSIS